MGRWIGLRIYRKIMVKDFHYYTSYNHHHQTPELNIDTAFGEEEEKRKEKKRK